MDRALREAKDDATQTATVRRRAEREEAKHKVHYTNEWGYRTSIRVRYDIDTIERQKQIDTISIFYTTLSPVTQHPLDVHVLCQKGPSMAGAPGGLVV